MANKRRNRNRRQREKISIENISIRRSNIYPCRNGGGVASRFISMRVTKPCGMAASKARKNGSSIMAAAPCVCGSIMASGGMAASAAYQRSIMAAAAAAHQRKNHHRDKGVAAMALWRQRTRAWRSRETAWRMANKRSK